MSVTTGTPPHFSLWYQLDQDGNAIICDQDSPEEILACVANIVACAEGFRGDEPEFGIPEQLFTPLPLDTDVILDAIRRWEPRVDVVASQHEAVLVQTLQLIAGSKLGTPLAFTLRAPSIRELLRAGGPGSVTIEIDVSEAQ